jgi:hypothetical protein
MFFFPRKGNKPISKSGGETSIFLLTAPIAIWYNLAIIGLGTPHGGRLEIPLYFGCRMERWKEEDNFTVDTITH